MNKWTPGPWVCQGQTVYAFNEKGHNLFFAHVMDVHTSRHELIANAHLISAAPELYEALESALKTAEFEKHPHRGWQDEARAALAKARGEA